MQTIETTAPARVALSHINPADLYDPRPNGYTHVVVAHTPARMIHIAGQGGENGAGQLAPGFAQQLAQALANLRTALDAADATLLDIVRITVLVVDHDAQRLAVLSDALRAAWGELPPACTLIPVPRLALDGMLVEIDATAMAPLRQPMQHPD